MDWREIAIDADTAAVEAISEILVQCGAGGVVMEDPELIRAGIAANIWDAYEFPDELLARDFIRVKAYLPCDTTLDKRLARLKAKLELLDSEIMPDSIRRLGYADVREEDWANSWKAYYKPVRVGERIIVKPTWEEFAAGLGDVVIELDPGMAFGTGTHPSTVMCLEMLEKVVRGGETVFDVGTGTGILAVAAAKLGAGTVKAIDLDEVAVRAAKENVLLNGVEDNVTVTGGDLLTGLSGQADILVANIVADVIIRLSRDAYNAVKPGGIFISSGIISPRISEVTCAAGEAGFTVRESLVKGDWVLLLAVREE